MKNSESSDILTTYGSILDFISVVKMGNMFVTVLNMSVMLKQSYCHKIPIHVYKLKILKIGRSPPRGALCDLDPNAPLEDDTKKLRLSRRVSFAETCQVK